MNALCLNPKWKFIAFTSIPSELSALCMRVKSFSFAVFGFWQYIIHFMVLKFNPWKIPLTHGEKYEIIKNEELGFYQATNKVAYLRNNQLFINQSVVVQQMDVGLPVGFPDPTTGELGLGQWSWKVHENSENPPRNNLYLKWIG